MTRKSFMSIKNMAFKKLAIACVAVVAMGATLQASVTLTSFTGSPNVRGTATFSVNAASSAREIWCAWGDSDKGTSFAAWPNNERVCTVPANATTVTSPLPWAARKGAVARFFLFPAGGTYSVSYLVTSGAQAIDTGIVPDPTLKISAELELEDMQTLQQRAFGVNDSNPCTVVAYVNNGSTWAWAWATGTAPASKSSRGVRSSRWTAPTTLRRSPMPDTRRGDLPSPRPARRPAT